MFKYNKLDGRIKEIFGTRKKFAEAMGLSEAAISNKMNNHSSFSQTDIDKAIRLLKIDDSSIPEYFFSKLV